MGDIEKRQTAVETVVNELRGDVGGLSTSVHSMDGKIDRLVDGLSSTGASVTEKTSAVKDEIREENSHRIRQLAVVIGAIATLVGGTAGVVKAIVGPYQEKIDQTSARLVDISDKVHGQSEVASRQGADIGRLKDTQDIQRERNQLRDSELREHDQDLAYMRGFLTARGVMSGR